MIAECGSQALFLGLTSDTLTVIAAIASAIAAFFAIIVSIITYRGQSQFARRQMIIPLWEYISSLNEIDPAAPIVPDILKALNTLEVVAASYENNIVDKKIIEGTFAEQFIKHYDNIAKCGQIAILQNRTGKGLLAESPYLHKLYNQLTTKRKRK